MCFHWFELDSELTVWLVFDRVSEFSWIYHIEYHYHNIELQSYCYDCCRKRRILLLRSNTHNEIASRRNRDFGDCITWLFLKNWSVPGELVWNQDTWSHLEMLGTSEIRFSHSSFFWRSQWFPNIVRPTIVGTHSYPR